MILEILSVILLSLIFITMGYIYALNRWSVKDLIKKDKENANIIDQLTKINQKQIEQINLINDTIKKNKEWYIIQLRSIGDYVKNKYSDKLINEQLNIILGSNLEKTEFKQDEKIKKYDIDTILDKISEYGIESLTIEELDFLKGKIK